MASDRLRPLRVALAWLLLLLALGTLGWALLQRGAYERSSVESRRLNDATVQAIELKLNESTTMYQINVAFLVALWGLILARHAGPTIAGSDPEALMAAAATLMLGAAIVWHYLYCDAIYDAYRVAGATALGAGQDFMPDVFRMQFHHLLIFQRIFFCGGSAMALTTLLSASRKA